MLLADSGYPLLGVMWTMFVFFLWILFIWLLVTVYVDLFRRDDVSGWVKTGWVIFTLVLPYIGVFAYLIVEGRKMAARNSQTMDRRSRGTQEYINTVSASSHPNGADEIAKAKELLDSGAITQAEYEVMKKKVLVG